MVVDIYYGSARSGKFHYIASPLEVWTLERYSKIKRDIGNPR